MRVAGIGRIVVVASVRTIPADQDSIVKNDRQAIVHVPNGAIGRETFEQGRLYAEVGVQHISPLST